MIGHAGRHGIETDVIQVVEAGEVGPLEAEGNLISTDTTFYVATTGSDTTGDGSSGSPWATLRKALSYLDEYRLLHIRLRRVSAGSPPLNGELIVVGVDIQLTIDKAYGA